MKKTKYKQILEPIIREAGRKAKKDWLTFKRKDSVFKNNKELVTAVDKKIEKYLVKALQKNFPEHSFLGEEFGHIEKKSDYLWIIDPIDGTTNFSFHNPLWCISVGLAYKKKVIFGMIYIPVLEELYWANINEGSYLNKKKIKIKNRQNKGKEIHTFCHGRSKKDVRIAINYYRRQKMATFDCRQLGAAAIELAYVAAGRVDSLMIPGTKDWDVAAGALIAKEAGAKVTNFKGDDWQLGGKDIIACKPNILTKIIKLVK